MELHARLVQMLHTAVCRCAAGMHICLLWDFVDREGFGAEILYKKGLFLQDNRVHLKCKPLNITSMLNAAGYSKSWTKIMYLSAKSVTNPDHIFILILCFQHPGALRWIKTSQNWPVNLNAVYGKKCCLFKANIVVFIERKKGADWDVGHLLKISCV